ncbi:MAG: right-handed parallel beta-helix repeat-containing protein, partial [Planctomycetes bacterium]|nr:right-handed parallel beta-helix repeat-containing protein [Planctomycetota bacterium]
FGNGLPRVSTEISINGNETTVQRDAGDATPNFRIFHVADGGDLNLDSLTVSGGSVLAAFSPANEGGGILSRGTLTLTNGQVSGNSATFGGGICSLGGYVELTHSIVVENSASLQAGGILNAVSGTAVLINSLVGGNSAGQHGAGIYITGHGLATLIDSTVSGNFAGLSAGGIWTYGELILTNSNVSGNFADTDGGGILIAFAGTVTMTNSSISGNFAGDDGGGIWNFSTLTMASSSVSGNTAGGFLGGGIFNTKFGTVTIVNSILANSTNAADCDNFGVVIDAGYNIVEDGTCISAPTSFSGDPMLGPLQDNGGPTMTHALLEGSPAIDAIPVGDCVVDTDQRGIPRPQGDGCDIGSYEVEESDPCADDDGDGRVTICHVPPGNTGNAHTITVSANALPAHLAHGDQCGPCEDELSAQRGGGKHLGSHNGARNFGRTSVAPRR